MATTTTFRVEWDSGKIVEVTRSDCETVEQFIASYFGRGAQITAKVTVVGEETEAKKSAAKPKTAKK